MKRLLSFLSLLCAAVALNAQSVNVEVDYNDVGDCVFSAVNNTKVPLFLYVDFADIQNAIFDEPLPYVKCVSSGFNSLFELQRIADADAVPRFNYDIKVFRSNPMPDIDLDFPYLFPFAAGGQINVFDVKDITGFDVGNRVGSWNATGFYATGGDVVFSCRNGVVTEIAGNKRTGGRDGWYNGWTNSMTILQPDGTLICYRNVIVDTKNIRIGEKVYAGQKIGEVVPGGKELYVVVYYEQLSSDKLIFIIPQFVICDGETDILNSSTTYEVVHPKSVIGLEMTKRERKKIMGKR